MKWLAMAVVLICGSVALSGFVKCFLDAKNGVSQDYAADVAAAWLLAIVSAACLVAAILIGLKP